MHDRLTLNLADQVVKAAMQKAQELKVQEDIAVVDAGGNLKAFIRMDNAWLWQHRHRHKKSQDSSLV